MLNALLLAAGIALLAVGGEALIRGALGLSKRIGVSPLLSGLVIVGFGTSMPEMVVSVDAVLGGQGDIAIGNIVGSNIANILLILGLCACIMPLSVTPTALGRDGVVVILASLLFIGLAWTGGLTRVDGMLLLAALASYLAWAYWSERDSSSPSGLAHQAEAEEIDVLPTSWWAAAGAVVLGLVLLITGSQVLLKGAIGIAQLLGVSEAIIGLTLVAVGTSLPELTISVMAALRRHADVAVGNILGSNIFNALGIAGVASVVTPIEVSGRFVVFDQWVMLAVAALLFVFLYTGRRLSRIEGGILLVGYLAYVVVSYTQFA